MKGSIKGRREIYKIKGYFNRALLEQKTLSHLGNFMAFLVPTNKNNHMSTAMKSATFHYLEHQYKIIMVYIM